MTARAVLAGVLLLAGVLPLAAQGSEELVGVEVVGGVSLTAETVEYYLGVAEGDAYDAEVVARGFRKLWESGLVEDLKIEAETVEPGKVKLIVTVRERPRVTEWAFEGNKKLSTSTIKEKLDTAGILLQAQRATAQLGDPASAPGHPRRLLQRGVRQRHRGPCRHRSGA